LYNLLVRALESELSVAVGSDEAALREIHNRLRAYIISSLTRSGAGPTDDELFDSWEKVQKEKITELEKKNEDLRQMARPENFLTLDDDDLEAGTYPRKGGHPKPPGGKPRGKK
jgi:hypothetical protein